MHSAPEGTGHHHHHHPLASTSTQCPTGMPQPPRLQAAGMQAPCSSCARPPTLTQHLGHKKKPSLEVSIHSPRAGWPPTGVVRLSMRAGWSPLPLTAQPVGRRPPGAHHSAPQPCTLDSLPPDKHAHKPHMHLSKKSHTCTFHKKTSITSDQAARLLNSHLAARALGRAWGWIQAQRA